MKSENKQIKKLTWKYFLRQKFKEVMLPVLIIPGVISISYLYGIFMKPILPSWQFEKGFWIWIDGVLLLMISIAIIGAIGLVLVGIFSIIISIIIKWMKKNWKKAREKAKKELKAGKHRR